MIGEFNHKNVPGEQILTGKHEENENKKKTF
jgi:hypothetical protein